MSIPRFNLYILYRKVAIFVIIIPNYIKDHDIYQLAIEMVQVKSSPKKTEKKEISSIELNPYLEPLKGTLQAVLTSYKEEDTSYGMRIDNLWNIIQDKKADVDFEQFEDCLLWLIHEYIEEVEPSEGISSEKQKIIYDRKVTKKYFHYIKISSNLFSFGN